MKFLGYFAWLFPLLLLTTANLSVLASGNHSVIIYFNGGCPICSKYVETLEHALNSAGIGNVVKYDYSADDNALNDRSDLREKFDVPAEFFGPVTTAVDGRYVFEGYFPTDAIVDFLSSDPGYDKLVAATGPSPDKYLVRRDDFTFECNSSQKIANCLSSDTFVGMLGPWALVLVSGLVNGLNPCALLVLVYFVGVVSTRQSRRGILKLGVFYLLSIFIVQLGVGLGLLRLVLLSGYVEVISRVFGILLISLAILGFKNALRREATFPVRIPKSLISPIAKNFSRSWIETSAVGAALLFGGLVAVLEFPCASGVYAGIIAVLSLRGIASVTYFVVYNLMSIMPLTILLALSYSVGSAPSLRESVERRKHLLRAVSALLLLGLGALLLLR